jgi:hypothetical protein
MIVEYHCNHANLSVKMLLFHTVDRRASDELPVEAQADRWDVRVSLSSGPRCVYCNLRRIPA